jgi:signal transduction histidine kinase
MQLSRVQGVGSVENAKVIELSAVVADAVDRNQVLADKRSVRLVSATDGDVRVLGDYEMLTTAVRNLIENAIKYGAKPGGSAHVTIDLALGDHDVELSVQDEGPGIEPEHLPRLTERFYRADAKSSRAKGGTGLGLAIVKHIVVRQSGRLVIESEPGLGTKFAVRIPKNKSGA